VALNKFLNAATDGASAADPPLKGYKIANPTILARISREALDQLLRGTDGRRTSSWHEPAL